MFEQCTMLKLLAKKAFTYHSKIARYIELVGIGKYSEKKNNRYIMYNVCRHLLVRMYPTSATIPSDEHKNFIKKERQDTFSSKDW